MEETDNPQQPDAAAVTTAGLDAAVREVSVALDTGTAQGIPINVVVLTCSVALECLAAGTAARTGAGFRDGRLNFCVSPQKRFQTRPSAHLVHGRRSQRRSIG